MADKEQQGSLLDSIPAPIPQGSASDNQIWTEMEKLRRERDFYRACIEAVIKTLPAHPLTHSLANPLANPLAEAPLGAGRHQADPATTRALPSLGLPSRALPSGIDTPSHLNPPSPEHIDWAAIRHRWPLFNPKWAASKVAFIENRQLLGFEPTLAQTQEIANRLKQGVGYPVSQLADALRLDPKLAKAWLWFGSKAGLLKDVFKDGRIYRTSLNYKYTAPRRL